MHQIKLSNIIYLLLVILIQFTTCLQGYTLRLIGGHDAPEDFGHFHASLQNLTGSHVCGGAVISKFHVVTAAHCVQGAKAEYIKIVVGTINLDEGGKQYDVEYIKIYENFNFTQRTNDIAILKVTEPFDLKYVDILKVQTEDVKEGDSVILTGFGAIQANGESSRTMHVLNLTVFCQETCEYAMRYSREVTSNMFCTFTRIGEGTCHGDSGGPLIKDNKLVGLVSWGIPCAVGFPDVHTRVTPYIGWIEEEIRDV